MTIFRFSGGIFYHEWIPMTTNEDVQIFSICHAASDTGVELGLFGGVF
jgi:hypothetical protein